MSESAKLLTESNAAAARPPTSAEPAAVRSNRRTSEGSQSAGSLRRWDYLAVLLTFAWATAIFAAYYVVQKPFAAATAVRLLGVAADGLVAAAIVAGSAGLGLRVIGRLAPPTITPAERLAFGALVGLGAVSLLWLAVGLAGLLSPVVALALTGALVALAFGPLRDIWRLRPALPSIPRPLWCYLAVMFALSLIAALTPATDWDGLS
ncbi:MAG TPA: hypothetical protein VER55_14235, partial [Ardenticatenaceae bacterium]|nr:hypothetical protein [Ardenticatenaceae bacterium]